MESTSSFTAAQHAPRRRPLYTPEQRARRDATVWTMVQGILAPLQLLACAVSAVLVVRFLLTGEGYIAATASISREDRVPLCDHGYRRDLGEGGL
jgi:hypothetical protein